MRVMLVGPEREENLSLRYLASSLRAAGHEPRLAPFDSLADLPQVVEAARGADAVGLSMCFQVRAREFLALAAALRQRTPKLPLCAGGHYATCAAEELLAHHRDLDLIVLHEGERTLVELADAGFAPELFAAIAGLVYRRGEEILRSPPRPKLTNLDELPFPDRTGKAHWHAGVRTAYVLGSRGCFSDCDYCCISTLHKLSPGPRFRARSVENLTDELAELAHGRGVRHFVFHDDNFLVPSVEKNHQRLDRLRTLLAARGVGKLGFTMKCRPDEVERGVFEKLLAMGLLRVFLGIESGSQAGLLSIGRHPGPAGRGADIVAAERALELLRDMGLSVQYTLMCFHPEATLETLRHDLAFFRRHADCGLNFCRVESYAGTPLEARLRAEGRGKGDYLARTYAISDPKADLAFKLARRLFHQRCWTNDSLMEATIGLDHLAATLQHFHRGSEVISTRRDVQGFVSRSNHELIGLLEELIASVAATRDEFDPELHRRLAILARREHDSRRVLLALAQSLRQRIDTLGAQTTPRRPITDRRMVVATMTLAASLSGCESTTFASEYAPAPLLDSDGDGLPDQCELEIFGTDPALRDSDGNGTPDGEENHDAGTMTNAEEQQRADYVTYGGCADAPDPIPDDPADDGILSPFTDTDGDGLPDQCELEVFNTDPTLADSDADGITDGGENHDDGTLPNYEEQRRAGEYFCVDVPDLGSDEGPYRLVDTDGDGLPDQCETEIFGTDPTLEDTDGDGQKDGLADSDKDGLSNSGEQRRAGDYYCVNVRDSDE